MKIKSGMRVVVIIFLIGSFLLTSCADAGTPVLDSTLEASQPPVMTSTTAPTATTTPEPGPSAANLPEGWAGRIDRIESVTGMDGVERTVAIERNADPEKESELRVLQWDEGKKEWTAYAPQVGKISAESEFWDEVQVDDLPVAELQARMNQETILGRDGHEIGPGVVAVFSDWTVLCGDIVDFGYYKTSSGYTNTDLVVAVPLSTGDIELFFIAGDAPNSPSTMRYGVYRLDGVDPGAVDTEASTLGSQVERYSPMSPQEYWTFVRDKTVTDPHRRVVFGVDRSGRPYQDMTGQLVAGKVFGSSSANVLIQNTIFMSAEEYDSIR